MLIEACFREHLSTGDSIPHEEWSKAEQRDVLRPSAGNLGADVGGFTISVFVMSNPETGSAVVSFAGTVIPSTDAAHGQDSLVLRVWPGIKK